MEFFKREGIFEHVRVQHSAEDRSFGGERREEHRIGVSLGKQLKNWADD
jgi:hypothetical protein